MANANDFLSSIFGIVLNDRRALGGDPGCPYCAGRKVLPGFNDLAALRPDLAVQWHPTLNKGLRPSASCRRAASRPGGAAHAATSGRRR